MSPSPNDFLVVRGEEIVLGDDPIILKGAGLGGWMNMENFITGYPAHEHQMRAAMKQVLGEEKYEYFFDKFLEYFWTDEDAALYQSLGLNCLRIPVNYRHFEDDLNPRVFKASGLKHLDRVIDSCAKHGIYTIIDLHSAPGGRSSIYQTGTVYRQNIEWHCDSGNHQALLYAHKDFQDRTVLIWEELAKHYKDNTWVAGYNLLNEPTDSEHVRLLALYERLEKAVRAIDPNHILFLDGNTFGMDFSHFGEPLPNTVYACHDYSTYGFPSSPELFTFGPVYQNADDGLSNWEEINDSRYSALEHQLSIYRRDKASWAIWLYKDIGFQGMVYVDKQTPYMRLLEPFLKKKKLLAADCWGVDIAPVKQIFQPMLDWLLAAVPGIAERYPKVKKPDVMLGRMVRNMLMSEELCHEYAEFFRGKSFDELDALAKSFSLGSCNQRSRLNEILKADAAASR
ncbi:hypothetical protein EHS25_009911 [Saitozyma podzolica]|uniref:Glycoside hydrolase family 5 domain-containing protein n=1 Tax=Saitozyma podzolica TaxID=1890683 RepID=A0A427YI22_9TREE|nr:hypothetical protein EHS25_009911 [Saitozyma podzolica]